jgi:hypothetical protein
VYFVYDSPYRDKKVGVFVHVFSCAASTGHVASARGFERIWLVHTQVECETLQLTKEETFTLILVLRRYIVVVFDVENTVKKSYKIQDDRNY